LVLRADELQIRITVEFFASWNCFWDGIWDRKRGYILWIEIEIEGKGAQRMGKEKEKGKERV